MNEHIFSGSIVQDGMEVATVSGADDADVKRELTHYAFVYAQDGPVKVLFEGKEIEGNYILDSRKGIK